MRIVIDTNVALSALLWRGTPYRLLRALRQRGDLQLVSSPTLLEELSDVLNVKEALRKANEGLTGAGHDDELS